MISLGTALFSALAMFGLFAGSVYAAVTGDRGGAILLVSLFAAAGGLAVALAGVGARDVTPFVPTDAGPPERASLVDATAARPSAMPFLGGVAAAVLAVGLAIGAWLVVIGLVLGVLVTFAWLAQSWREHTGWAPLYGQRLTERVTLPFTLPVTVVLLVAVSVISLSRVLLAVPPMGSVVVATTVSLVLLGALAFVAARPQPARTLLLGLSTFSVVALLAAGVVGIVVGEREFEPHEGHAEESVEIEARQIQFDVAEIELPADEESTIDFRNHDDGVYHNVAIYTTQTGGTPLYSGQPITEGERHYEVPALDPGSYFFRCDFHPAMLGEVVVG